jgi:hypothetical protein
LIGGIAGIGRIGSILGIGGIGGIATIGGITPRFDAPDRNIETLPSLLRM